MVIDGETVITGSFNFTKAAEERNAENLLIVHDRKLAEKYVENWLEHAQHSNPYMENEATKEHPVLQELVQEMDEVSDSQK